MNAEASASPLKFKVNRDVLADAVTWATKTLPNRPSAPVLTGILITAEAGVTVQAFLERGLLDELTISWLPLAIGDGTRLFSGNAKATFAVRGSHVTPDGLVRVTYDVVH